MIYPPNHQHHFVREEVIMSSKASDEKRRKAQDEKLLERYGGRIARSGRLAGQIEYGRFYCFECGQHFMQRVAELVQSRAGRYGRTGIANTRCFCPPMDPSQRFKSGDHSKSKGHMVLPEWDQWDLPVPDRLGD